MLLVTSSENSKMKIEILDLLNLGNGNHEINLNMDERSSRYGTIGIPFQNQFLISGGLEWNQKKNYRLDDSMSIISKEVMVFGEHTKNFVMNVARVSASYVLLNHNKIWITGGLNRENDYEESKSTEFISYDENSEKFVAIPGPKLPFKIFYHCMVQVDAHRIYIIGGVQNHQSTAATWIVNPLNFSDIKSGPRMWRWRSRHSCAKMEINGKIFIVVVGDGLIGINVETVELLDTSSPNQKWTMGKIYIILIDILKLFVYVFLYYNLLGPHLPFHGEIRDGSAMFTSPTGKGVILICWNSLERKILELSGNSRETLQWSILDKRREYYAGEYLSFSLNEESYQNLIQTVSSKVLMEDFFLNNLFDK